MCLEAGAPVALSSDAHRPEDVGADYEQALELLAAAGVRGAVRVRAARAPAGARSDPTESRRAHAPRRAMSLAGIGYDSHRLAEGRRLILGGVEIPERAGLGGALRRRRADPRGDRRAARRGRAWATSASTSPTPTSAGATPTRWSCSGASSATVSAAGLRDRERRLHGGDGARRSSAPTARRSASGWRRCSGWRPNA